jgi:hypothetical protein
MRVESNAKEDEGNKKLGNITEGEGGTVGGNCRGRESIRRQKDGQSLLLDKPHKRGQVEAKLFILRIWEIRGLEKESGKKMSLRWEGQKWYSYAAEMEEIKRKDGDKIFFSKSSSI